MGVCPIDFPPTVNFPMARSKKTVTLIANGDLRITANQTCWKAQCEMEAKLTEVLGDFGYTLKRAHKYDPKRKHGFIESQKEGNQVFTNIDPESPLIVAESVWQYSHHLLPGLMTHRGPILTVANWSGTWPGLGRHAQPQRLADQGRRRLLHAVE